MPGLDSHEYATLKRHSDLPSCLESLGTPPASPSPPGLAAVSTTSGLRPRRAFLFGPESRRLPPEVLDPLAGQVTSACACPCAKAIAA